MVGMVLDKMVNMEVIYTVKIPTELGLLEKNIVAYMEVGKVVGKKVDNKNQGRGLDMAVDRGEGMVEGKEEDTAVGIVVDMVVDMEADKVVKTGMVVDMEANMEVGKEEGNTVVGIAESMWADNKSQSKRVDMEEGTVMDMVVYIEGSMEGGILVGSIRRSMVIRISVDTVVCIVF